MVIQDFINGHRLGLALDDDAVDLANAVGAAQFTVGIVTDQDARAVLLAGALQARRQVHAVTDDGVVHALR